MPFYLLQFNSSLSGFSFNSSPLAPSWSNYHSQITEVAYSWHFRCFLTALGCPLIQPPHCIQAAGCENVILIRSSSCLLATSSSGFPLLVRHRQNSSAWLSSSILCPASFPNAPLAFFSSPILSAFSRHTATAHDDLSPAFLVHACPLPCSELNSSITSQNILPRPPWLFLSLFFYVLSLDPVMNFAFVCKII